MALISIFGLCFMSVCLIKSNFYYIFFFGYMELINCEHYRSGFNHFKVKFGVKKQWFFNHSYSCGFGTIWQKIFSGGSLRAPEKLKNNELIFGSHKNDKVVPFLTLVVKPKA